MREKNSNSLGHMFYKTFSGTDSLAFMLLPDSKPILLGSLTTLSYSMYRDKKPVSLVSRINISGYTRGMRVIAGTMIFTLVNQHMTKDLIEQVPYLAEHGKIKADELPLFDIMVISANEYGSATKMMIYGVDITDDAQVLSIQDLFTENTFNFVARDLDEFTAYKDSVVKSSRKRSTSINAVMPYDFDIDNYESSRMLFLNNIRNDDLVSVQSELVNNGLLYKASGVYDNDTVKAIEGVQSRYGLSQTGVLDKTTFDIITTRSSDDRKLVTVKSSNGAFVYKDKAKSKVNGIAKHKDNFLANEDGEFYQVDFFGDKGYISKTDTENNIEYDIDFLSEPSIVGVDNGDYSKIGASILPKTDMDIKVSAIAYYGNEREAFSKYISVRQNDKKSISLSDFSDAYIYNVAHKSKPNRIVFIILNQGVFIHKWDVRMDGGLNE